MYFYEHRVYFLLPLKQRVSAAQPPALLFPKLLFCRFSHRSVLSPSQIVILSLLKHKCVVVPFLNCCFLKQNCLPTTPLLDCYFVASQTTLCVYVLPPSQNCYFVASQTRCSPQMPHLTRKKPPYRIATSDETHLKGKICPIHTMATNFCRCRNCGFYMDAATQVSRCEVISPKKTTCCIPIC